MEVLFVKAGENVTTVTEVVSIGELDINVADPSGYETEDHVFMSETDASELEYLGICTGVDGNTISVSLGVQVEKSSGAAIWTATNAIQFDIGKSNPAKPLDAGVRIDYPVGGGFIANKIADDRERITFSYPIISKTKLAEWETFRDDILSKIDTFTMVDEDLTINTVKSLLSLYPTRSVMTNYGSIVFSLGIITAGGYV